MNLTTLTISAVLATSVACFAQSESLGDVARQQRSTSHVKARRVVTNDNLPKASPSEAMNGTIVVPKAPEAKEEPKAAAKPSAAKTSEAAPASPADAQKRLDELKGVEEAEQRAVAKFEQELKDDSVSAERRALFEEGLANAKQLLDEAAHERENIEKALAQPSRPTEASGDSTAQPSSEAGKSEQPADNPGASDGSGSAAAPK